MSLKSRLLNFTVPVILATALAPKASAQTMSASVKEGYFLPQLEQSTTQYQGSGISTLEIAYEDKNVGFSLGGNTFSTVGNTRSSQSHGFSSQESSSKDKTLKITSVEATVRMYGNNPIVRPYLLLGCGASDIAVTETNAQSSSGIFSGEAESSTVTERHVAPSFSFGLGVEKRLPTGMSLGIEAKMTGVESDLVQGGYSVSGFAG